MDKTSDINHYLYSLLFPNLPEAPHSSSLAGHRLLLRSFYSSLGCSYLVLLVLFSLQLGSHGVLAGSQFLNFAQQEAHIQGPRR